MRKLETFLVSVSSVSAKKGCGTQAKAAQDCAGWQFGLVQAVLKYSLMMLFHDSFCETAA